MTGPAPLNSVKALESSQRLRRLAEGRASDADHHWLAERVARYLDGAPSGLRLDEALDLTTGAGTEPWWRKSARAQRDGAIREFAARICPGLALARQAAEIAVHIRRYEATGWLRDRVLAEMPAGYAGRPKECLYRAFRIGIGVPTGVRQLRTILTEAAIADDAQANVSRATS